LAHLLLPKPTFTKEQLEVQQKKSTHTWEYLKQLGVPELPARTSPFDPGYDAQTLEGHLEQSCHLMSTLKISMACWMIANETITRRKISAARRHGVTTVTGGGPFEIAVSQGLLSQYLDLCGDIGVDRIECGQGFTECELNPREIVHCARERGLEVQMELGKKHDGGFDETTLNSWIQQGQLWLEAGAVQVVVEARESACGVGLFDDRGQLNARFADRFVEAFGFETVVFEAPNKPSQFALLNHFGNQVGLCNVRLEELLRVEIYRRGLHSDAYAHANLRPSRSAMAA
jgi:phosphosulfolactate synthase